MAHDSPCSAAALAACAAFAQAALAQTPRPLPSLEAATRIVATADGAELAWPDLLDRLATFDVVFLGETHVDDTTHRVERHVLEGLLARKAGKVVLSMEMFERDVQPVVDDYLAGRIDEPAFLARARPWNNYATAYRPLVEAAKTAGIPVVAANFPGTLRRRLAGGDAKAAIDGLPADLRALLPAAFFPASAAYWERVDRAVRGHMGFSGGGTPEARLYETQNLWDNAMGDAVAQARAAHPEALVLHVAGGFHTAYRDGTVAQFAARSPGSTFAVVSIAPALELHGVRPDRDAEQADFLVYAAALARDWNEGNYAVTIPAELRYRLELPHARQDVPLLVWLPDRGTRVDDAMASWLAAVGDGAAVAVVEHPFPELQDDLAPGGRYVFGDGFRADYGRVAYGLARLVEYVTRRFPVDPARVVVAGKGDGGAVVLWAALYGDWLPVDFVAIEPSDLTRLGMEALPDQKPVARSLLLCAGFEDDKRLQQVADDYTKVGLVPERIPSSGTPRLVERLRGQLRLPPRTDPAGEPWFVVLADDRSPRAREWADLHAEQLRAAGRPVEIRLPTSVPANTPPERVRRLVVGGDGPWPVAAFADGRGLPLAGGPFGGTTVVVLPSGTSAADRASWLELEQKKVLKRRSMFANLAVASQDGEPSLPEVLKKLKAMGRSRVLVVPAAFCADAATMQELRRSLGDAAAGMDLAWLPGLGAELARSTGH
ncbi:MAG: ChaN family lipoprotein [Planctomycetes bacterium]|nr:ChaN family lipoprotein [Planctomycetota bacterium]